MREGGREGGRERGGREGGKEGGRMLTVRFRRVSGPQ